jgi:hypothetical protein
MDAGAYQQWQGRLEAWLASQPPLPEPPWPPGSLPGQVARLLAQARLLARGIPATLEGVGLEDRNKYDFLLENLERFLGFQEFSLAEYTYVWPGGGHPGLRLLLEEEQWRRRVAVLFFEDVRLWRVDEQGGKVSHQLLLLDLGPTGLEPRVDLEAREYYQPQWDWARALRQAMSLPVLLLRP